MYPSGSYRAAPAAAPAATTAQQHDVPAQRHYAQHPAHQHYAAAHHQRAGCGFAIGGVGYGCGFSSPRQLLYATAEGGGYAGYGRMHPLQQRYYGMYHHYVKRLGALGECRRRMARAARHMRDRRHAAAAEEMKRAANAMNAADTANGDNAADNVERAANNVANAGNSVSDMANNKGKKNKAENQVNEALNDLENGNVQAAGSKLKNAGKAMRASNRNNKNNGNNTAAANAIVDLGEALEEAGRNLIAEQRDAANERVELDRMEAELNGNVDVNVKRDIQEAANNQVNDVAVNGVHEPVLPDSNAVFAPASINNGGAIVSNQLAMHMPANGGNNAAAGSSADAYDYEMHGKHSGYRMRRHVNAIRDIYGLESADAAQHDAYYPPRYAAGGCG